MMAGEEGICCTEERVSWRQGGAQLAMGLVFNCVLRNVEKPDERGSRYDPLCLAAGIRAPCWPEHVGYCQFSSSHGGDFDFHENMPFGHCGVDEVK